MIPLFQRVNVLWTCASTRLLCYNLVDHRSFPHPFSPHGAIRLTRTPIPKLSPTNTHVMTCNRLGSRYRLALSNTPAELKGQITWNRDHLHRKHCMGNLWTSLDSLPQTICDSEKVSSASLWERPASLRFIPGCLCFMSLDRLASLFPMGCINGKASAPS